jgi:hypothetical protein
MGFWDSGTKIIDSLSIYAINILIRQINPLRRMTMKLTPPKEITFGIAVVLGLLGLFSFLGVFTLLPIEAFWLLFIGFALLVVALLVKGL